MTTWVGQNDEVGGCERTDNGKGEMRGFFPFGKLRVRMTSKSRFLRCAAE
jgi:hypothetical protein